MKKKGRTLIPTPLGKDLAHKADTLFAVERTIETFLKDSIYARVGSIQIAATYLPANFLLPKWAGAFKVSHPDINITIQTTNSK